MAANGIGWSCNYNCIMYTDPDLSNLPLSGVKDGLVLWVQQFNFFHVGHDLCSKLPSTEEKDDSIIFFFPSSRFSTIESATDSVSQLLQFTGIPTSDVDSLAHLLFSHFCRRRQSSDTDLVVMALDFGKLTVLRNDDDLQDWLYSGTMNSVVVRTLKAVKPAIKGLEKTKYDGALGEASARGVEECMVCLEEFGEGEEVTWLPCRHGYHGRCIGEWLMTNHRCPICRFPMPWVSVIEDRALQPTYLPEETKIHGHSFAGKKRVQDDWLG